tara:strand:- start:958 stop:1200 length:243 start_codon:yes stop_codon:yes gene_type:complete
LLKDHLVALLDNIDEGCTVARLRKNLDEETLEAFDRVMASSASTRGIWMELKKEGMSVDRGIISRHRQDKCECLDQGDAR